jgi:hypothetical protein
MDHKQIAAESRVYATNAGAQAPLVSGVLTAIIDWTAVTNVGGNFNALTGIFTCLNPIPSFYDFRAQLAFNPLGSVASDGFTVLIQRSTNGGALWTTLNDYVAVAQTSTPVPFFPQTSVLYVCNQGDLIRVAGLQQTAAATPLGIASGLFNAAVAN